MQLELSKQPTNGQPGLPSLGNARIEHVLSGRARDRRPTLLNVGLEALEVDGLTPSEIEESSLAIVELDALGESGDIDSIGQGDPRRVRVCQTLRLVFSPYFHRVG